MYPELSIESLGLLNYLHAALAQPREAWGGFYMPQSQSMNFALRYQLAFSTYALAALASHTPAYRAPYARAMQGAIEKMLHPDVWSYWRVPAGRGDEVGVQSRTTGTSHVAVLIGQHRPAGASLPADPVAHDNLQYSGHLSAMLGLYEKVSGDGRYDEPFTLTDPASCVSFAYTHGKVAGRIHAQMEQNRFGGVCCEPGMAYVACNNHAMASNTLHDALHGTRFSRTNAAWLRTVRDKLVLRGPALRGVFGTAYMKDLGLATPVAFNFTDAWGLAFMLPFSRPLARKLYPRFKRRAVADAEGGAACISSSHLSERMEISDVAINTGFGLLLARGMGDLELANRLQAYLEREHGARWQGNRFSLAGAARTLHSTALYALALAVEPGGENFVRLFNDPSSGGVSAEPSVRDVHGGEGPVGVTKAVYRPTEAALQLALVQVGAPEDARSRRPISVRVELEAPAPPVRVECEGRGDGGVLEVEAAADGVFRFSVEVPATGAARVVARFA